MSHFPKCNFPDGSSEIVDFSTMGNIKDIIYYSRKYCGDEFADELEEYINEIVLIAKSESQDEIDCATEECAENRDKLDNINFKIKQYRISKNKIDIDKLIDEIEEISKYN